MQRHKHTTILDNNPLWYKDAIVYAVHVRAFKDNDGDGIGDLPGLTENWHRFDRC